MNPLVFSHQSTRGARVADVIRTGAPVRGRATVATVALTGLVLVLAGCGKHESPATVAPELPAATVQLVTARAENSPVVTDITGTVRPVQRAVLAAKVMGAIEELPVRLGQSVRAGDVLVKISAAEISARVLQAESQFNLARRDLERERGLLAKGASTADMVKGLEDRFAAAQAMVREAEAMLGYATIRAPFDGVVARKHVNPGDLAAPGVPLIEVEGTDAFEVDAALPDSLAGKLKPGMALTVNVPVAEVTFAGSLAEISSAADASAHTVFAKITVPPGTSVRSGQFARVQVPGPDTTTLFVPATAVSLFGQMERVFVAGPDHRAVLRLVKTGAARENRVEILSGLDDGEQVVVAAPAGLLEGQPLAVAP